jgi:hypothetical protein
LKSIENGPQSPSTLPKTPLNTLERLDQTFPTRVIKVPVAFPIIGASYSAGTVTFGSISGTITWIRGMSVTKKQIIQYSADLYAKVTNQYGFGAITFSLVQGNTTVDSVTLSISTVTLEGRMNYSSGFTSSYIPRIVLDVFATVTTMQGAELSGSYSTGLFFENPFGN